MEAIPRQQAARARGLCVVGLLLAVLLLASCGDDGGADGTSQTPTGPVTVTFWHSMQEPAGAAVQRIADRFNQSQDQYQVEVVFQGSYTESLNKLIASVGSGNIPSMIQLSDASTQIMVDSGVITPIQQFIDEERYDLSDFEPKALDYYTLDGVLYSMPFNLAGPILYYDRAAFEDAGLDPDKPPRTLEEVRAYSERLLKRDEQGKVVRRGIALQTSAWFFEQMLALGGALDVNAGNGREGRATEAVFDNETGTEIMTWWAAMIDDGVAYNAGDDVVDAMLKLASGEVGMAIASTAALRGVIAAVVLSGRDPAQYDTASMPGPLAEDGGIALGGASFWILSRRPEEEQRGAWEFIKFTASTEEQAQWHADTGYFPNRLSAYDERVAIAAREEFPQFTTAIEQLRASPDTPATRGVLLGPLNAVRDRIAEAFEQVLSGGGDPARELEAAADDATEIIKEYNRTAP